MKFTSLVTLLLSTVFVSAMQFDTNVVKDEYKVGEDLVVSIVNNYDEDHWMVGIPSVSISLYDESGTTELYNIMELIQLKTYPAFDQAATIQTWKIPEQIETEYKTNEKFSLVVKYLQSIRGTAKPLDLSIEHPITIRGIQSTGNKAIPKAEPRKENLYPTDKQSSVQENPKVQYTATWAYNMIKSLLVNHLL
ncbi:hypothetical protein K493DRAFT_336989 [Basidiobolus meristosporus CBS 931.73]|uniref:Uncharacterized protein n=1 Tax=Basidiobolus meristosporus CBS 931.73 TaxID=1314790 RepID=A0A1Y1WSR0_9FUNG|nr:hypothetical protein K493DRAFT_363784 [Basidiobolus meristosporus CBS 931.73]ORX96268.1 hypothetical protein K493DRAFT_336989 [Basidiobolus meristosporus CBS 931.73]|eukprot:ORX76286.1 hypothetical protein K493DRAFT_363784 [Basidiobolus meristosporus CBS 931.73]